MATDNPTAPRHLWNGMNVSGGRNCQQQARRYEYFSLMGIFSNIGEEDYRHGDAAGRPGGWLSPGPGGIPPFNH